MVPGAIVIAGDPDVSAVAEVVEVVEVVDKPAGRVVHLRVLPGAIEDYEALVLGRSRWPRTLDGAGVTPREFARSLEVLPGEIGKVQQRTFERANLVAAALGARLHGPDGAMGTARVRSRLAVPIRATLRAGLWWKLLDRADPWVTLRSREGHAGARRAQAGPSTTL